MSDHKELCALLRELCDDLGIDAADLIEQQAARIAYLEKELFGFVESWNAAAKESGAKSQADFVGYVRHLRARISELESKYVEKGASDE